MARSTSLSWGTIILLVALAGIALCGTAGAVSINEYLLPGAGSCPFGIAGGPDGALWFTEWSAHRIGRISKDGVVVEYPLPTSNRYPGSITVGPDGALWFTEQDYFSGHLIGRISTSGGLTEYQIPTTNSQPASIAAGPDGALWFTENASNRVGRITTDGQFTEYPIPTPHSFPYGITAGPDGALWFTESESSGNKIGRISTSGNITEYSIPTFNSGAFGITTGPDGALWFTESSKIGRITTAGVISEYSVPSASSYPRGIAAGPDGALWFVELYAGNIGRISTTGSVTEYAIPKALSNPENIILGSDGAVWFTECAGDRIGQLQVNGSGGTAPSPTIIGLSPEASNADQNQPYSGTLTAMGGSGGNKWTNVAGSLPIGLSLNTDTGVISGTPTIVGISNFTIQVRDSGGQTDTKAMSLNVNPPVALSCGSLPDGSVGSHYDSGHVYAEGGLPSQSFGAYTFSIISGSLPPGVAMVPFDATTVNFWGMPSQAGAFQFTLRAVDHYGSTAAAQCSIAISGRSNRSPAQTRRAKALAERGFHNP
jgi:virginiamycin B lyase